MFFLYPQTLSRLLYLKELSPLFLQRSIMYTLTFSARGKHISIFEWCFHTHTHIHISEIIRFYKKLTQMIDNILLYSKFTYILKYWSYVDTKLNLSTTTNNLELMTGLTNSTHISWIGISDEQWVNSFNLLSNFVTNLWSNIYVYNR